MARIPVVVLVRAGAKEKVEALLKEASYVHMM